MIQLVLVCIIWNTHSLYNLIHPMPRAIYEYIYIGLDWIISVMLYYKPNIYVSVAYGFVA